MYRELILRQSSNGKPILQVKTRRTWLVFSRQIKAEKGRRTPERENDRFKLQDNVGTGASQHKLVMNKFRL